VEGRKILGGKVSIVGTGSFFFLLRSLFLSWPFFAHTVFKIIDFASDISEKCFFLTSMKMVSFLISQIMKLIEFCRED
jgi:hypothetical protein